MKYIFLILILRQMSKILPLGFLIILYKKYFTIPPQLKNIILLVKSLNEKKIWENYQKSFLYFQSNYNNHDITSCGLTSQAIFNVLRTLSMSEFNGIYSQKKIDINRLLDVSMIRIGMSYCNCCSFPPFPGHAFLIYNDKESGKSLIIQSYCWKYNHTKHFDVISRKTLKQYLTDIKEMYDRKIINVKALEKITHISLKEYTKCCLSNSQLQIHYTL